MEANGQQKIYAMITERVIALLDAGIVPWRKPWDQGPGLVLPKNLASGRPYRGINVWLLLAAQYASPWWLSFKQAQERGGRVRKGERATPVVFWKLGSYTKDLDNGETEERAVPILRYYSVFNVAQCEGVEAPAVAAKHEHDPIPDAAKIVREMPNPPEIADGHNRAAYSPQRDLVMMPNPSQFPRLEAFYATLFHELVHSTGHESRLKRKGVVDLQPFGAPDYSREELVAEMGAAFLCAVAGIENVTLENQAAYIASWKKRLEEDEKLLVIAGQQAQKASDYILGASVKDEQESQ